ncbi:GrpB family protein [Sediminibacillus massiliensis]|uniref:GrpB family protein n=1 Tax=Sediminibacillus massiliensis TaxID=1926277 RepID=UPI001FEA6BA1|nr:GrpB family protein [Sediminibacillus massiliensis]
MIGNRRMNINVSAYKQNWVGMFEKEAKLIRKILKEECVDIHHIGSTAVPNLKAKPIIDIMPTVKKLENVDALNDEMRNIGYEALGEFGINNRRYFRKGGENRTHQVHIFQYDNNIEIERHLAVRDYLQDHESARIEYGNLKEHLANKFPKDIEGYSNGKDAFMKKLEQKALEWKRNTDGSFLNKDHKKI